MEDIFTSFFVKLCDRIFYHELILGSTSITVISNAEEESVPTHIQNRWRVCVDYRKLNLVARKYHFPLPFIDQRLKRLTGKYSLTEELITKFYLFYRKKRIHIVIKFIIYWVCWWALKFRNVVIWILWKIWMLIELNQIILIWFNWVSFSLFFLFIC